MTWMDDVLHFWFSELGPKDWFAVNAAVDDAIEARFGELYREMKEVPPAPSSLDARGHLAAVIVFDQFSRNLFRHTAKAFTTDALALSFSLHAVEHGMDDGLDQYERQFLYMPFMHCEDVAMQERSLKLSPRSIFPTPAGPLTLTKTSSTASAAFPIAIGRSPGIRPPPRKPFSRHSHTGLSL